MQEWKLAFVNTIIFLGFAQNLPVRLSTSSSTSSPWSFHLYLFLVMLGRVGRKWKYRWLGVRDDDDSYFCSNSFPSVHHHGIRRYSSPALCSACIEKDAPVSGTQHTFMEIYFGPAVIGSSEPDPEALRLGLRSECSPTTKRQSGESVIKNLVDLMGESDHNAHVRQYGQEVSDLLIGRGKEGVYISSPSPCLQSGYWKSLLSLARSRTETTFQHQHTDRLCSS